MSKTKIKALVLSCYDKFRLQHGLNISYTLTNAILQRVATETNLRHVIPKICSFQSHNIFSICDKVKKSKPGTIMPSSRRSFLINFPNQGFISVESFPPRILRCELIIFQMDCDMQPCTVAEAWPIECRRGQSKLEHC